MVALGLDPVRRRPKGAVAAAIVRWADVTFSLREDRDPALAATTTGMTEAIVGRP